MREVKSEICQVRLNIIITGVKIENKKGAHCTFHFISITDPALHSLHGWTGSDLVWRSQSRKQGLHLSYYHFVKVPEIVIKMFFFKVNLEKLLILPN